MSAYNLHRMDKIPHQQILNQLNWRYATQKFDPDHPLSDAEWETLEASLVLTASSFGLQPWRFVVVTDPDIRHRLVAASYGQQQPRDASHVVVFAIQKDLSEACVDRHIDQMARIRQMPIEKLAGYRRYTVNYLQSLTRERACEWAARQTYLALGSFLTAAAMLGVDTCPMEGIDPAQYDQILELDTAGFSTVVVCCAGHRSVEDKYAKLPKVRFERKDVVMRIESRPK
jgi:nitroreductase